jgi:uncharacterized protein YbjQ (UPF0145 family)
VKARITAARSRWIRSSASLEGVPDSGRARLEQNKEGLFTSDLTVNEFLLITEAGFDPLGLVVGSSIYHDALGADGIVGVRLDIGRYEWGRQMAEFIAIGTAVRHRDGVLHRAPNGRPFTSDLSGQAFWTLLRTGHRPVGMVMGSCVYHVAHRGMMRTLGQIGQNVELPNYTQALYDARELAMQRMQSEAQALEAKGIVGVDLQEKSHGWGSHIIEFFAIGTAIVPTGEARQIDSPTQVLDLNDP